MEEWGWVVRRVGENEGRGGRESECGGGGDVML